METTEKWDELASYIASIEDDDLKTLLASG